jgi:hypothetical protein
MKIYLPNLEINEMIKNDNLYITSTNKQLFYSNEGIYAIENNYIYRLNFIDDENIKTYTDIINNHPIITDNTEIKKEKVYQLPNKHHIYNYKEYEVKIHQNKTLISLVIQVSNNVVNDHYFITNEKDVDNIFIKQDINKLISYIN